MAIILFLLKTEKFVDATASASGSPSPPLAEYERDSPVDVSSTSEAGSASGAPSGSRALSPPPRNPQLTERWSSEEMRHIQCHLETKELWDKFNELGTEMIITKTGSVVDKVGGTRRGARRREAYPSRLAIKQWVIVRPTAVYQNVHEIPIGLIAYTKNQCYYLIALDVTLLTLILFVRDGVGAAALRRGLGVGVNVCKRETRYLTKLKTTKELRRHLAPAVAPRTLTRRHHAPPGASRSDTSRIHFALYLIKRLAVTPATIPPTLFHLNEEPCNNNEPSIYFITK
ncbi:unnamed protein product [Euphydryas editha]|uniref:T-box domain-containing protein n=1 Tax=Euphydryas editha TaxID=104508 RepID=A0AAU9UY64_EUPED|nr:unnamed protein product [Euphydryas editha]